MDAALYEIISIYREMAATSFIRAKLTVIDAFNEQAQQTLLSETVLCSEYRSFQPSFAYRKLFLKTLITFLESSQQDINEDLLLEYTNLLNMTENKEPTCFKIFSIEGSHAVMKESTTQVSCATTGLCTWPGSLWLTEWAVENKQLLKYKRVLELGSGVGTAGLLIAQCCQPAAYIFTDCSEIVLETLRENILRNIKTTENGTPLQQMSNCTNESVLLELHLKTDLTVNCTYTTTPRDVTSGVRDKQHVAKAVDADGTLLDVIDTEHAVGADDDAGVRDTKYVHSRVNVNAAYITDVDTNKARDNGIDITAKNKLPNIVHQHNEHSAACTASQDAVTCVSLLRLDWTDVDLKLPDQLDVILAAEVIYDPALLDGLCTMLDKLLQAEHAVAYIVITERNAETVKLFVEKAACVGLSVDFPTLAKRRKVFFYDDALMKLAQVYRLRN